jgi:hypothetical protein
MRYKIREIVYNDIEIGEAELITVSEAARLLAMTEPGVIRAIERGKLTAIVDTEKVKYRGSTMLIKSQVEQLMRNRA